MGIYLPQNQHSLIVLSAATYGFASIEPALTLATLFTEIYQFDTVRNGYGLN